MTTCIAAITGRTGLDNRPDVIVTASDTRASFGSGDYSADGSVKLHMFHKDWGAMIAGSPEKYVFVINRAKELLHGKSGHLDTVSRAFKKAYQDQVRESLTDEILSPFEYTLNNFKRYGSRQLPPHIFAQLSAEIKSYRLGCTFLVYGLDDLGIAHIFTVRNPGKIDNFDKPGYWAIGNGASAALIMLSGLRQVRGRTPFADTVYNVLASKYFSEKASDVGPETEMWVQMRGTRGFSTKKDLELNIRKTWEEEGVPKTSEKAVELIKNGEWKFTPRMKRSKIRMLVPWQ